MCHLNSGVRGANARIAGLGLDAAMGPLEFAAQAGVAWNLQVEAGDDHGGNQHATLHDGNASIGSNGDDTAGENEMQAYAQVIANTTPGRSALKSALAGNFFKLLVTNQHQMNSTQTLAGAAEDFTNPDSWRLGFNIQRRLRF